MPEGQPMTAPQDGVWYDAQYPFNGNWMPDIDPALIGPTNFATIENCRYNDSSIEGIGGYTKVNDTALSTYINIKNGHQLRTEPSRSPSSYTLVHAVDATGNGRVYQHNSTVFTQSDFDSTSKLDTSGNAYFADSAADLVGRLSDAPQNSIVYCNGKDRCQIYSGKEQRIAAAFLVQDEPDTSDAKYPKDVTEILNSSSSASASQVDLGDEAVDSWTKLLVMTTRPAQALKFYVETAATDDNETMTIKTWTGSAFDATDLVDTDGTLGGLGQTLTETGTVTFSSHTNGTAKLMHYQELYLFAYLIEFTGNNDAVIYHITADMAMQDVQNVWDGVYRQPIQCQVEDNSVAADAYQDYTLHVNQSSDTTTPVGLDLTLIGAANDNVIIMFEEQMAGIRAILLGNLLNDVDSALTVKYWDGDSFNAVTNLTDGTATGAAPNEKSMAQSGLISWTPSTTEKPITLFGSVGYAYELTWDAALDDADGGSSAGDQSIIVDLILGVPALLETVKPFDWSCLYKNRLMLGAFSKGAEGNRMDFSVTNAPDVFNGSESSADGIQSLYFGGVEPITCGTQLYNRFGATIYSMLLVMKATEMHLMVGDGPDDFTIYPVSTTVGCPFPKTLDTAEIGLEIAEEMTRSVALWVSNYGPMMFDGAVIKPIRGIENFFDPLDSDYINWDAASEFNAWVDPIHKEYNILLCTGTATSPNTWVVYDLVRRKWYEKNPGVSQYPLSGWQVMNPATGERGNYAGRDQGQMVHLEKGTSWNATYADATAGDGITQVIKTGDFFPSNNIWDECLIRKIKVISKKLTSVASGSTYTLSLDTYINTQELESNVAFQDADTATDIAVSFQDHDYTVCDDQSAGDTAAVSWESPAESTLDLSLDVGLQRDIRYIKNLNKLGWAHAFRWEVTTDDIEKGWQPIIWGIRYRIERKDDTET